MGAILYQTWKYSHSSVALVLTLLSIRCIIKDVFL